VVITGISAQNALELKHQLTRDGLIIDQDYTWRFQPVKYNDWGMSNGEHSKVEFEFCKDMLASFYRLKWAK
jgi:hypothetical protein